MITHWKRHTYKALRSIGDDIHGPVCAEKVYERSVFGCRRNAVDGRQSEVVDGPSGADCGDLGMNDWTTGSLFRVAQIEAFEKLHEKKMAGMDFTIHVDNASKADEIRGAKKMDFPIVTQ
ncbi:unnamed protein product, partial [Cuscuta epithymum]